MTLAPLLDASPVIQFHAFLAMGALALGVIQVAAPKGTIPHRAIGWTWTVLMMVMLGSAFFVHGIVQWGPFNPKLCLVPSKSFPWVTRCAGIHVLTIYLLLVIPYAVLYARRHHVDHHRRAMLMLLAVALVVAGAEYNPLSTVLGTIAVGCSATNVFGGFLITVRQSGRAR